jgi:hypothetical protein
MRWQNDAATYFRECLKIQDKTGQLVPFESNEHQSIVNEEMARQEALGIPVRIIILKERQSGNSTISQGHIFRKIRFSPANAKVVAHDVETTELLFKMCRRFYDNLPKEEQIPLESYRRKGLEFSPPHGGTISIGTAGTDTTGRGGTTMYLHCSEVAYYPDSQNLMASLLNSVPDVPGSMVILESTANGMGGWFHDMWLKAKAKQSAFVPLFFSWKDFSEYSSRVPDPTVFESSLNPKERYIRTKFNLTLQQLYWRRNTIQTKCSGDEQLFAQEYPLDDVEAFIVSGRGKFDRESVSNWPIQEPLLGYLEMKESYTGKVRSFIPNKEGWLRLWKRPQPGREYVIGGDVAEGIEIDGAPANDKYDYSCADVFDKDTGEQVCQIHGNFEPDEFGRQVAMLGEWYNWAYVGIESNNHGLTTLNEIKTKGYPESKIFHRTQTPDGSSYGNPQVGWKTTTVTRPNMINKLAQAIREQALIFRSSETQSEFLAFVIKPNGRMEANAGFKDDRVFSAGIALEMMERYPSLTEQPDSVDVEARPQSYRPTKYNFSRVQ